MSITAGTELFKSVFTQTSIFSADWIIGMILTIVVMLLITRDVQKWKSLALPVTMLLNIMGIKPHILWFLASAIIFAIDAISIKLIGQAIAGITTKTVEIVNEKTGYTKTVEVPRWKAITIEGMKENLEGIREKNRAKKIKAESIKKEVSGLIQNNLKQNKNIIPIKQKPSKEWKPISTPVREIIIPYRQPTKIAHKKKKNKSKIKTINEILEEAKGGR